MQGQSSDFQDDFTFFWYGDVPCHIDDDFTAYFSRAGLEIVSRVAPLQIHKPHASLRGAWLYPGRGQVFCWNQISTTVHIHCICDPLRENRLFAKFFFFFFLMRRIALELQFAVLYSFKEWRVGKL